MTTAAGHVRPWCRVLVVDHDLFCYGSQQYVLRQADLLARQGVELVLAGPSRGELARTWTASGRLHVPLERPRHRALVTRTGRPSVLRLLRETYRILRGAWATAAIARRVGADVLDANSYGWAFNEVVLAGWLVRRPSMVHLHMLVEPSPVRLARAVAARCATAVVAVSHAVARSLPSWATTNIHVIHPGVDTTHFTPGPASPTLRAQLTTATATATGVDADTGVDAGEPRLVLVLARLVPTKGIDHAIRAVANLPPPLTNTHLAVAGTAPNPTYHHTLRRLADHHLPRRTHLLGHRTDTSDLLRAADVLLLPSQAEGLGLCLLEAHATRTPTIAYPAGGCAELIEHNTTGLLAQQDNIHDLTHQLTRLLTNPSLAHRLATNAHHHITHHHTLQRQCDAHVALLRQLMRSRATVGRRIPRPRTSGEVTVDHDVRALVVQTPVGRAGDRGLEPVE